MSQIIDPKNSIGMKLVRYVSGVIAELKKVNWPTRQETLRLAGIVFAICAVMGAIMGGFDYGFTQLVNRVFTAGM